MSLFAKSVGVRSRCAGWRLLFSFLLPLGVRTNDGTGALPDGFAAVVAWQSLKGAEGGKEGGPTRPLRLGCSPGARPDRLDLGREGRRLTNLVFLRRRVWPRRELVNRPVHTTLIDPGSSSPPFRSPHQSPPPRVGDDDDDDDDGGNLSANHKRFTLPRCDFNDMIPGTELLLISPCVVTSPGRSTGGA